MADGRTARGGAQPGMGARAPSQVLTALRREPPIAYFSMEIALDVDIPTYSGGLGVLAGDTVRSAADLGIPFVAITQLSRRGYFRQRLDAEGRQTEEPVAWNPADRLELLDATASVRIEGREVLVQVWAYVWASHVGDVVPVLFLDTDVEGNDPRDRAITQELYGGDAANRLRQEIILGIGGARILAALGLRPRKFHINEGHAALACLELLRAMGDGVSLEERLVALRRRCVFTTHTPVEAGHDRFGYDLVDSMVGPVVPPEVMRRLGGDGHLNMTLLALNSSGYVNGVAQRHREVSAAMFPGHRIFAVTNGVHSFTWTAREIRELFDEYIPGWALEPTLLARVDVVPAHRLWAAHQKTKAELLELVRARTGVTLELDTLTIGFARRATAYKRPCLLFSDLDRLRRVRRRGALQCIFAGKAHPRDEEGKRLIMEVHRYARALGNDIRCAYIPDYDMSVAQKLVAGVDVWLNTPEPPLEASGTSGMKAAHNGVLNFSVLDGWWIEGHQEGVTGWSIGPRPEAEIDPARRRQQEIDDLYGKLEYVIVPTYYHRPDQWLAMMKESIDDVASYFNAHRMLRRYVTDAYFPFEPNHTLERAGS